MGASAVCGSRLTMPAHVTWDVCGWHVSSISAVSAGLSAAVVCWCRPEARRALRCHGRRTVGD